MIALAPTMLRLLVVDDDVVILRTIKRYLKDFEVTCVETGAEAVEAAPRVQPDLILLDFNLPDSTGIEVMRTIRARGVRAPVLLMSGAFDSGAGAESLAYEADDYIAKPFLREALMRKLDRLLGEHELAQKVARQHAELVELHERRDYEASAARALLDQMVARGQFDPAHVRHALTSADQFPGDVVFGAELSDGRYRWMVGDVTGHSLASALVTIPLAGVFYTHARSRTPLPELIEAMDRELGELLPVSMFCTAVVCELDRRWGTLQVWNGGCPDVVVMSDPHVRFVTSMDPPLATRRRQMRKHEIVMMNVEPGDRVFAFSDGLPECRNPDGRMLGMGAVCHLVSEVRPPNVIEAMQGLIREFTQGQPPEDDISMIEVVI